jgi:transcription initiation factor IIE alpha subunit
MMARPLLGEILLEKGEITQEQLDKALEVQKNEGGLIGIILVNQAAISEQVLVKYLALQAEKVTSGE